ncbi:MULTISPECIES: tRNA (N6-threonylcarbamoyladenosine(37)-N6)-methyltransferase TrmO [Psychrobacter]|uniref:tRNA (N6-threonylcarbamoyladenosine(37)-N6)-methyltransferase TrmO n=1 Tax=Psychrobacter TaxID=497 RepID=UPI000EDA9708|nr:MULTISPECIES: tRNA (N6-threonylcarbamoyladenosine(37)-N6)-methyltransferase TrmO [Psychrobacter]HCT73957.1 tRNA (N6-threonylcarbamoyladenosine(37)-N6)-methyltransferase TrmO [Psychrobacter sp.]
MSDDNLSLDNYHQAPIIGYHRAPLSQKFGAPRQPNLVALNSAIEMLAPYDTPAAFEGLEAFSHIWISWQFHHNYTNKDTHVGKAGTGFRARVRPPRLGGNQKIGVFASRSMYRPSALGLSVVKLESIEVVEGGVLLIISGADMIDGTPIIDIKPYVAYSDVLSNAKSGFAPTAPDLLEVIITESAYEQFMTFVDIGRCDKSDNKTENKNNKKAICAKNHSVATLVQQMQEQLLISDIETIKALIAQDPRPAYRRAEINTPFVMRYKSVDVSFQLIDSGQLQITVIVKVSL